MNSDNWYKDELDCLDEHMRELESQMADAQHRYSQLEDEWNASHRYMHGQEEDASEPDR